MSTEEITKLKQTTIDKIGGIYCITCLNTFPDKKEFDIHYAAHLSGPNAPIIYTCVTCLKEFDSYQKFRGHCYNIHVNKERFKCETCQKIFSKASALKLHTKAVHQISCTHCDKIFSSKKDLNFHKIIHMSQEEPPYNCHFCCEEILTPHACEEHVQNHSEYIYPCPMCNKDEPNKTAAVKHLETHFATEKLEYPLDFKNESPEECALEQVGGILCSVCKDLFDVRSEFDHHYRTKHKADPVYSCNICKKQFEKYKNLGAHCYEHTVRNKFECELCHHFFPRLSILVQHISTMHTDAKEIICIKCDKKLPPSKIRRHMNKEHSSVAAYTCPNGACKDVFDNLKDLISHQKIHEMDKWCQQCGLSFPSLHAAIKHLDHHRKKTFFCPICKRTYNEFLFIGKHLLTHFQAMLVICKVCGMTFGSRSRLKEHTKIHSTELKFVCRHCSKPFLTQTRLDNHLILHSGEKPYKCIYCPRMFASYPNCYKHVFKTHKVAKGKFKKSDLVHNNNEKPIHTEKIKMDDISGKEIVSDYSNDSSFKEVSENVFNLEQSNLSSDGNRSVDAKVQFGGEDEFAMDTDCHLEAIDLNAIVKELESLEDETSNSVNESLDLDLLQTADLLFQPEATSTNSFSPQEVPCNIEMPCEYGPDFTHVSPLTEQGSLLNLDDQMLPYVDPKNLTISKEPQNIYMNIPQNQNTNIAYQNTFQYSPLLTQNVQDWNRGQVMVIVYPDICI